MRLRSLLIGLVILMSFAVIAQADTLKMKNGTVIRGKVISFNNKEFIILMEGTNSRSIINVDDIESIEFDNAPAATVPVSKPPQNVNRPPQQTNPTQTNDDNE